ncbi:variable surface protein Vir12-like [Plasmodium vivax]|uniref:Variable surface protein Vir12-like n=1 Tax=Plasmodium vivax (strain Salvador I) TaxID=126793 RepID=A5KCU8_PLAVS|nr:variable surface protein Vir12-like [Plasmodium vivax]EDL42823.1 variable surface protein Vir12-like [Plasmodium vivax]|eukprot:XP_001612610.1 variable surface protein Vir12-like [Plasmodium vivax Sal-1]
MVDFSDTELEAVIKTLPSHGLYESFDKDANDSEYSGECNKLSKKDDEIKHLCSKFLRNLKDLKNEKATYDDKHRYLTFWIYDKLYKMFGSSEHMHEKQFIEILHVGNDYYKRLSKQLYLNDYEHDFNRIREMKHLHDYFKNCEKIINCKTPPGECNKYIKYVSYIKELYEKHYRDCCFLYNCIDEYFDCDSKYNPTTVLSVLRGNAVISHDGKENGQIVKDGQQNTIDISKLKTKMNIAYLKCFSSYNEKINEKETDSKFAQCIYVNPKHAVPSKKEVIVYTKYGKKYNPEVPIKVVWTLPKALIDQNETSQDSQEVVSETVAEENDVEAASMSDIPVLWGGGTNLLKDKKFRTSVATALAVFAMILFYLYYKYTPFGNWISRGGPRKKKNNYPSYEHPREDLLDSHPEPMLQNMNKKRIRLAYQA